MMLKGVDCHEHPPFFGGAGGPRDPRPGCGVDSEHGFYSILFSLWLQPLLERVLSQCRNYSMRARSGMCYQTQIFNPMCNVGSEPQKATDDPGEGGYTVLAYCVKREENESVIACRHRS